MEEIELERRVDTLERYMMELAYQARRTEIEVERLSLEMREFKEEMKDFKNEMKEFKEEMKEFKNEMREFKNEMRQEVKRMNKQWGELANKLGTIVEDIVAPSIGPVLKKYFNCEPEEIAIRVKKRKGNLKDEFDAIAVCDNKVFLFEVKATPRPEYVLEFKENKSKRFKELFDEHRDKELILIFASLRLEKDILNFLTNHRIYGMAYREWEYMDILNFEELSLFEESNEKH